MGCRCQSLRYRFRLGLEVCFLLDGALVLRLMFVIMLHTKVLPTIIAVPVSQCRAGHADSYWFIKIVVVSTSVWFHQYTPLQTYFICNIWCNRLAYILYKTSETASGNTAVSDSDSNLTIYFGDTSK
jgi:hypothetical protein